MNESGKCKRKIQSFGVSFRDCGRPVKAEINGELVCGIHAAAERKRDARAAAYEAEREESRVIDKEGDRIADRVVALGLARPRQYSVNFRSVRRLVVDFDALTALLDTIEAGTGGKR